MCWRVKGEGEVGFCLRLVECTSVHGVENFWFLSKNNFSVPDI